MALARINGPADTLPHRDRATTQAMGRQPESHFETAENRMKKRTYSGKPMGDTEWLLEQWGWWRMDGAGIARYVWPYFGANYPALRIGRDAGLENLREPGHLVGLSRFHHSLRELTS